MALNTHQRRDIRNIVAEILNERGLLRNDGGQGVPFVNPEAPAAPEAPAEAPAKKKARPKKIA